MVHRTAFFKNIKSVKIDESDMKLNKWILFNDNMTKITNTKFVKN